MKTNYRKILGHVLATFLVLFVSLPVFVLAESGNAQQGQAGSASEAKKKVNDKINDKFCTALGNNYDKMKQKIEQIESKIRTRKTERAQKWEEKSADITAKLTEARKNADAKFTEKMNALKEKALTDEQKTAIEAFIKTEQAAVSKRRAAVDAARKTFQSGVSQAINSNQAEAEKIAATFRTSVANAFEKAQSSCSTGTDPQTVRTTLRAELKAAKDKLSSDRKALGTSDQVKALVETRKAAMEKARTEFRATMDKALADLKAAFPEVDLASIPTDM